MKPYYEENGITIYHGDCREILPSLAAETFDLTFTSPPYNLRGRPWPHIGNWKPGAHSGSGGKSKWNNGSDGGGGVRYSAHGDNMPWPEYVEWQQSTLKECWRLLTAGGAIFYNHKPRVIGAKLWTPLELIPEDLILRQIIIWARAGGLNFNPTAYLPTHEWILLLAKPDFRLRSRGASGVGDVWNVPQESNTEHPAPFPLALPARALESTEASNVLDPFCGSGATLRAAKDAGCKATGIDTGERYCEIAAKRLSQEVLPFALTPVEQRKEQHK